MKKKIFIGLGVVFIGIVGFFVYANLFPKSPPTTASFSHQGLDIKVTYSQPSKRGRLIFGEEKDGALQPYGKYWRLGANAATEITFSKDITFSGKPVRAGSYRMYALPGADSFQISLNTELGVFFGVTEPDYSKDAVKVSIIHKGVGQISESDVLLASASDAIILGFQVRPSANAKKLAEQEEIEIRHE